MDGILDRHQFINITSHRSSLATTMCEYYHFYSSPYLWHTHKETSCYQKSFENALLTLMLFWKAEEYWRKLRESRLVFHIGKGSLVVTNWWSIGSAWDGWSCLGSESSNYMLVVGSDSDWMCSWKRVGAQWFKWSMQRRSFPCWSEGILVFVLLFVVVVLWDVGDG